MQVVLQGNAQKDERRAGSARLGQTDHHHSEITVGLPLNKASAWVSSGHWGPAMCHCFPWWMATSPLAMALGAMARSFWLLGKLDEGELQNQGALAGLWPSC